MNSIKFSVVIPLYNKRDCIERAINSVVAQSHQADEIIIIDDGSTDGSADIVNGLKIANIKLVTQVNQGVSEARNAGANLASNEFIAFLDADDTWSPFFLSRIAALIEQYPEMGLYATRYQKVYGDSDYQDAKIALTKWDANGYEMDNYFEVAASGDLPFTMSSIVVRKSTFRDLGGFPRGEWMGEDQSFYVNFALYARIAYSPLIESFYFQGTQNSACDKAPPKELCPFAERLLCDVAEGRITARLKPMVLKYVGAHICDLAKRHIKHGSYDYAAQLLSHPVSRTKPIHWSLYKLISAPMAIFSKAA
ncbi:MULTISPECIES: glycosyltransferase family 2 protein [Pseudoalteromonas]|uniref:Glycosyltransferase family 2 protein n=1 Tax=Pseudoalteromonas obscura TaxID=3048491 RepID=A0ABT7EI77_9GAMM|nr:MULTISPECIES: glycosyltransferase family 2 protein [Pseudoalteromonas]MBQ4836388.1 glycosyltransferase family 2 protein [Pseudoalteromonas luteoviolacea]MDK2594738.1 glycosyltransferase family 2 protein [Pseudoalteromonas sp. P94(2023)]